MSCCSMCAMSLVLGGARDATLQAAQQRKLLLDLIGRDDGRGLRTVRHVGSFLLSGLLVGKQYAVAQ